VPAILQKGEIVIPKGAKSAGQQVVINYSPNIDARGADAAAVARLEAGQERMNREMNARIIDGVRKAQKANYKLS